MLWKKIYDELHFWEIGILQNLLKFNGLWPYGEKYSNIKFIMTCVLAFCAAICALIGCFHHEKTESTLFTIFRASLYLHAFLQRCIIKYRKNSLLILFIIMHENWNYSRFLCLRDRNIMINYAKNTKRLILLITLAFTCGTIGWIIDPIIAVWRSGNRNRLVFAISYLPSWKLSPYFEILFFLQAILTIIGVISTLSVDGCVILMMNHCCGQIEILREKIKHFRGIICHNVDGKNNKIKKLLQNQCTCLKCIIDKHNLIIDFARIMENCLSEIMLLQLIPGTVSMCSNGYELFRSYYNNEIFAMFWHIVYIFTVAPIFFIFCWLGENLLEKSNSIGDAIFELDWYNFDPKTRYLFVMIINRVRRPMRLTGGHGLFIMSFERYKNWFMNSISYLSVIAATLSRN